MLGLNYRSTHLVQVNPFQSLIAASVGGISLTLLRDALDIIGVNILNWYGAVIAQSGRQFDESGYCFFMVGML